MFPWSGEFGGFNASPVSRKRDPEVEARFPGQGQAGPDQPTRVQNFSEQFPATSPQPVQPQNHSPPFPGTPHSPTLCWYRVRTSSEHEVPQRFQTLSQNPTSQATTRYTQLAGCQRLVAICGLFSSRVAGASRGSGSCFFLPPVFHETSGSWQGLGAIKWQRFKCVFEGLNAS